jgi:hypothetical protein
MEMTIVRGRGVGRVRTLWQSNDAVMGNDRSFAYLLQKRIWPYIYIYIYISSIQKLSSLSAGSEV